MDVDGDACKECRYNQLASPCCRAGLLRRSPPVRCFPDEEDYISVLPDDLRLKIVSHLDCIRGAANMSLLSSKWSGLWRHLPKLDFHNITVDPLIAALGQVPHPAGSSLNIKMQIHHKLSAECISSILRAAAPVEPAKLDAVFFMDEDAVTSVPIELPVFDRATSIKLSFPPLWTTLFPTGDFTKLETLSLTFCNIALGDLVSRCPMLRKLKISCGPLDWIKVHSDTLEELDMYTLSDLRVIDIATPKLKKLRFASNEGTEDVFSLSFSAPLLDDLLWQWWCLSSFVALWRLWNLKLKTEPHRRMHLSRNGESSCSQLQQRPHDNILLLKIGRSRYARNLFRSFRLDISRIPVRSFSILELDITAGRHVYGAVVLEILGFCTSIQRLKIMLNRRKERKCRGTCHASCPCDRPRNWRSQKLTLTNLKEVEVEGFREEDHEVDLLKVIFRSTTMLEGVTLKISKNVSPECSVYKELRSILDAHPSVKFYIYSCNLFEESSITDSDLEILEETSSDESDD